MALALRLAIRFGMTRSANTTSTSAGPMGSRFFLPALDLFNGAASAGVRLAASFLAFKFLPKRFEVPS